MQINKISINNILYKKTYLEVEIMNVLLIFFALPIAVIIISAILQKIWNSPVAVAAFIFAIFLVVAFAVFNASLLIATLAYTILAFITAVLVRLFCNSNENNCICETLSNLLNNTDNNTNNNNSDLNNINNKLNDILNSINNLGNNTTNSNTCCRNRRNVRY